ncbi:MAG: arsenate reductase (glutaredoxin) [Sphingomonadales bacterium]
MPVTIWHNPRCSKSRQTLSLLEERDVAPEIVLYLEEPPSPEQLDAVLGMMNREPREVMRAGEAVYKELGLGDPTLDRSALIRAMSENPILIERPIVIYDGQAAIGRPPESVLKIL